MRQDEVEGNKRRQQSRITIGHSVLLHFLFELQTRDYDMEKRISVDMKNH